MTGSWPVSRGALVCCVSVSDPSGSPPAESLLKSDSGVARAERCGWCDRPLDVGRPRAPGRRGSRSAVWPGRASVGAGCPAGVSEPHLLGALRGAQLGQLAEEALLICAGLVVDIYPAGVACWCGPQRSEAGQSARLADVPLVAARPARHVDRGFVVRRGVTPWATGVSVVRTRTEGTICCQSGVASSGDVGSGAAVSEKLRESVLDLTGVPAGFTPLVANHSTTPDPNAGEPSEHPLLHACSHRSRHAGRRPIAAPSSFVCRWLARWCYLASSRNRRMIAGGIPRKSASRISTASSRSGSAFSACSNARPASTPSPRK